MTHYRILRTALKYRCRPSILILFGYWLTCSFVFPDHKVDDLLLWLGIEELFSMIEHVMLRYWTFKLVLICKMITAEFLCYKFTIVLCCTDGFDSIVTLCWCKKRFIFLKLTCLYPVSYLFVYVTETLPDTCFMLICCSTTCKLYIYFHVNFRNFMFMLFVGIDWQHVGISALMLLYVCSHCKLKLWFNVTIISFNSSCSVDSVQIVQIVPSIL